MKRNQKFRKSRISEQPFEMLNKDVKDRSAKSLFKMAGARSNVVRAEFCLDNRSSPSFSPPSSPWNMCTGAGERKKRNGMSHHASRFPLQKQAYITKCHHRSSPATMEQCGLRHLIPEDILQDGHHNRIHIHVWILLEMASLRRSY